ncbi:pyruvate-flavodoxin oxidoreductase, partial [Campylobacter coli]|nr:pyruvate-flavodoxin oxidoreductase [Campylobacter coli]
GMKIATENTRYRIENIMNENMQKVPNALAALFKEWIANKAKGAESVEIKDKMIPILEQNTEIKAVQDILNLKHFL